MDNSSIDNQLNRILLKPRFTFLYSETRDIVIKKFEEVFRSKTFNLRGKIVGNHVIIDVAKAEEHIWSPQLQVEVTSNKDGTSTIKGLFGPKPQLWTLFMFIHFGVALVFAIFATMLYTNFSLGQDYTFSLMLTIAMPIVWVFFYIFGRLGKKKGHTQMVKLDTFLKEVLNN